MKSGRVRCARFPQRLAKRDVAFDVAAFWFFWETRLKENAPLAGGAALVFNIC
jgi:hypothetical protein